MYIVLYLILYHLICKFLDICYRYRTVEAVGLALLSSRKVCLFLLKIGLPIKIGKKLLKKIYCKD